MAPGLQRAHFVLAVADANATLDGRAYLQKALDTHCWDRVARTLVEAMKSTGLSFTGADLKQAYAPNDDSPCVEPEESGTEGLAGSMQSGQVVDGFANKTLPDRFGVDFTNFFKPAGPGSFADRSAEASASISNYLKAGIVGFGGAVTDAIDAIRVKFDRNP